MKKIKLTEIGNVRDTFEYLPEEEPIGILVCPGHPCSALVAALSERLTMEPLIVVGAYDFDDDEFDKFLAREKAIMMMPSMKTHTVQQIVELSDALFKLDIKEIMEISQELKDEYGAPEELIFERQKKLDEIALFDDKKPYYKGASNHHFNKNQQKMNARARLVQFQNNKGFRR